MAARASHLLPRKLDEEVWPRYRHPAAWNVNVKAGIVAAILGHEDEGHSWGGRR